MAQLFIYIKGFCASYVYFQYNGKNHPWTDSQLTVTNWIQAINAKYENIVEYAVVNNLSIYSPWSLYRLL